MVTIKDIGEQKLLDVISQYCDRTKNGDDGAVISPTKGKNMVVTTDVLVENVHFCDRTVTAHGVGYRAVSANLSDLAAMGAMAVGITVGLSLDGETALTWVEELYQGMKQCLDKHNVGIMGGDITRSSVNTIAITALGEVNPSEAIFRHQARVGDVILVTGYHGLSKAGLELLLNSHKYPYISLPHREKLIKAHQYPEARLDVIHTLQSLNLSRPIAGMDTSDGLADAIIQICQQSKVGAKCDRTNIPITEEIKLMTDRETALNWVLYGGEDFELVLCLPLDIAKDLQRLQGEECHIIGEITSNPEIELFDSKNPQFKLLLNQDKTFQHF